MGTLELAGFQRVLRSEESSTDPFGPRLISLADLDFSQQGKLIGNPLDRV